MPRASLFSLTLATVLGACGSGAPTVDVLDPAEAPTRIVAASVFAAEVLLAIAPRERIAAVHAVAADPRWSLVAGALDGLERVGAEPEDLLRPSPDLVVVDPFTRPETLAILGRAGVPVLRVGETHEFADIAANIRRIGRACLLRDEAERLVDSMEARLSELAASGREAALGSIAVMSLDGALHTYGRGSLFDAVVRAAGARNLSSERGVGPFRKLDVETVLSWRPSVLVIGTVPGREEFEREWLAQTPGFGLLPAVRDDRLVFVPGNLMGSTSHHLVEAVAFLQQALRSLGGR